MNIYFRQMGGYAGITLVTELNSGGLQPAVARQFENLLENADLDAFESKSLSGSADCFASELVITSANGVRRFTFGDVGNTEAISALLGFLRKRASVKKPIESSSSQK